MQKSEAKLRLLRLYIHDKVCIDNKGRQHVLDIRQNKDHGAAVKLRALRSSEDCSLTLSTSSRLPDGVSNIALQTV